MVQYVSWGGQTNLAAGQLALAQQYADAGMMARAKAAFIKAGGTWDNNIHKLLKTEAAETTRYGGDIAFKWTDYGVRTQEQLNQIIAWAKEGNFSKIASEINKLGGSKKWNDSLHKKLAAEYVGAQAVDADKTKPGWQGTTTTELKRNEPTVAPVFEPNVTDGVDTTTTAGVETPWRSQFVAPITTGQEGTWGGAGTQARADAKKWRDLHMNAAMKKAGLTRVGNDPIQRSTTISDADWNAFKLKRDKIAARHKKLVTSA